MNISWIKNLIFLRIWIHIFRLLFRKVAPIYPVGWYSKNTICPTSSWRFFKWTFLLIHRETSVLLFNMHLFHFYSRWRILHKGSDHSSLYIFVIYLQSLYSFSTVTCIFLAVISKNFSNQEYWNFFIHKKFFLFVSLLGHYFLYINFIFMWSYLIIPVASAFAFIPSSCQDEIYLHIFKPFLLFHILYITF